MAYLVEDGSGLATSNAYITVQEFKDHHIDRGVEAASDGTFLDTEVEQLLIQATDYIDKRFGKRFRGYRRTRDQALMWPRMDAYDNDDFVLPDLPTQLKKATAEYALIAGQLDRNLAPLPDVPYTIVAPDGTETTAKGAVIGESETVGPVSTETRYADGDSSPIVTSTGNMTQKIPEYPQADLWLEELLVYSRDLRRG